MADYKGPLCDACETVSLCSKNGCVPLQPAPLRELPKSLDLVEQLMEARFGGNAPRSEAYKIGTRAVFELFMHGKPLSEPPYVAGTAQADAFYAGQDEGRAIVDAYLEKSGAA